MFSYRQLGFSPMECPSPIFKLTIYTFWQFQSWGLEMPRYEHWLAKIWSGSGWPWLYLGGLVQTFPYFWSLVRTPSPREPSYFWSLGLGETWAAEFKYDVAYGGQIPLEVWTAEIRTRSRRLIIMLRFGCQFSNRAWRGRLESRTNRQVKAVGDVSCSTP